MNELAPEHVGRPPVRIGLEAIHTSLVCVSEHKGTATWSSVAASRDLPMRARKKRVQLDSMAHGGRRPSLRPPRQQRGGGAATGIARACCCILLLSGGCRIARKVTPCRLLRVAVSPCGKP
eukprot:scaffold24926_cov67-Phaeocystis_antarctica.AAC.7